MQRKRFVVQDLKTKLATLSALKRKVYEDVESAKAKVDVVTKQIELIDDSIALSQRCMDELSDSKALMEGIINALNHVFFGDTVRFEFKKVVNSEGSVIELDPIYFEDGEEVPPNQMGGGIRNLTSWAIRFATVIILYKRFGIEPLLVMDEQLLNLDTTRHNALIEYINELASSLDIPFQYISITHADVTTFPFVSEVYRSGKVSKVKRKK